MSEKKVKSSEICGTTAVKDFNWYLKAAEEGDAAAQNEVGDFYYNGRDGVEQSFEEAFKWWMKSAKQGFAEAQKNVGWCYFYGLGVKENKKESV